MSVFAHVSVGARQDESKVMDMSMRASVVVNAAMAFVVIVVVVSFFGFRRSYDGSLYHPNF